MNLRCRLASHHPGIDAIISSLKQGLILIKFGIAQPGKMQRGKPAKKEIGFLHPGVT